jgi:hypothetical protein
MLYLEQLLAPPPFPPCPQVLLEPNGGATSIVLGGSNTAFKQARPFLGLLPLPITLPSPAARFLEAYLPAYLSKRSTALHLSSALPVPGAAPWLGCRAPQRLGLLCWKAPHS